MNNETRKELMEVIEAELDSYCPSPFNGAFAVSLMQIIDRLLADRWLDELPAKAWLNVKCNEAGCVAVIQMPKRSGARYLSGTGPTRREAIEDAVNKVKSTQEGAER